MLEPMGRELALVHPATSAHLKVSDDEVSELAAKLRSPWHPNEPADTSPGAIELQLTYSQSDNLKSSPMRQRRKLWPSCLAFLHCWSLQPRLRPSSLGGLMSQRSSNK
jgi:hypothetical protein